MKRLGLHCPKCGKKMLRSLERRPAEDSVRRRKECVSCKNRVTTIETIKKAAT